MNCKIISLVLIVLMASGCVSTKNIPIPDSQIESMSGSTLVVSKRELPSFSAMTAGKAMFGALGAAAMISAGNKVVKENEVADPAVYIAEILVSDLSKKYGLSLGDEESVLVSGNSSSKIAKVPFKSDYLLDVQTVNWSFGYFPADWNSYRVIYSAKLRLINGKTKKVEAEGFCSRVPSNDDQSPSYDDLLANNAERLKAELRIAADYCVEEFKTNILNI